MSKGKLAQLVLPLWALVAVMATATDQHALAVYGYVMMAVLGIFLFVDAIKGGQDD